MARIKLSSELIRELDLVQFEHRKFLYFKSPKSNKKLNWKIKGFLCSIFNVFHTCPAQDNFSFSFDAIAECCRLPTYIAYYVRCTVDFISAINPIVNVIYVSPRENSIFTSQIATVISATNKLWNISLSSHKISIKYSNLITVNKLFIRFEFRLCRKIYWKHLWIVNEKL